MGARVDVALRIGEIAQRAGVTSRTLRYYEEQGLMAPTSHSPGGARRYSEDDVARLVRIRELQDVMGFNLEEIRRILQAEDRLAQLRIEFRRGQPSTARAEAIVAEALEINARLREQVQRKRAALDRFLDELDSKARKYRRFRRSLESSPIEAQAK